MEYGLIGEHLTHSFSKEIHSYFADYDYDICEIPPEKLEDFFKKKDFKGINVTIPYKKDVIKYLDEISYEAKETGSVNTVVNRNGKLYGYNTDCFGLKNLLNKNGIDLKNKNVLILGTGGTSNTAFFTAKSENAKTVLKVSRTPENGEISYSEAKGKTQTDVIINTTPCGMFPNACGIPLNPERFPSLSATADVIYNPLRTLFVLKGKENNIKTADGLYMLVSQAVKSSEIFLNEKYSDGVIDDTYKKIVREKENIVLTGMPGCGKTTLGKALANILNRDFFDTDELIQSKLGKTPAEIINTHGEKYFRDIETEIIKSLSVKNGCVISTGGGSILKKENVEFLKQNGKLVFLNKDISLLPVNTNRPLSSDKEKLMHLYKNRIDIYNTTADITINCTNDLKQNTDLLKKEIL